MVRLPVYAPMLAQLGTLSSVRGPEWAVEMKWDGVRALVYVEDGAVRLLSRNGRDVTPAYPELQLMASATNRRAAVLDGEVVAFDEAGRPSFEALQPRMHQRHQAAVAHLVRTVPVTFMAFDILHLDNESTIALPYTERRGLLESTLTPGYRWQVPVWFSGHAEQAFDASRQLGLEGVVCKRMNSPYRPGRRSPDWTKVKNVSAVEVVIGGWKPGGGRRSGLIGSLLLGAYDPAGRLRYVGHVGTGFTQAMLRDLGELVAPLERREPPFDEPVPREHARDARWVEPRLVGEVQYAEVTSDGRLRHPSWRGLRPDREPSEARTEEIAPPGRSGQQGGTATG
ncbi:bifunctional non-homologous end joining protein LigD [Nonomuraea maritima]|uniref:DNA ligase (ATP) n=1 Tax=Nonomuraea maritima TaxID=683260 RepID=A0A1G9PNA1_9ACTN|nr:non-homologous end-joining DNA ligase [Nonomuraea maritima]SDM00260.1 bifunctional non-homologous end joining protein LigD [Nonomuraea maritima]